MTADSPVGVDGTTAASIPERLISGPSDESRLTGKVLFLLAGLAALAALATNIILPAFPRIGDGLGVSAQEGTVISGRSLPARILLNVSASGRVQSYLRPVSAAHVAAGPDESPQIRSLTT